MADPVTACRQCGGVVVWKREGTRWQCFEADGVTAHWDTCSQRRWQQTVKTGERFEERYPSGDVSAVSGYRRSVHGTKFDKIAARTIRGAHYTPFHHQAGCSAAPWEDCACPGEKL